MPPENAPSIDRIVNSVPLLLADDTLRYEMLLCSPTDRGLKVKGALDEELRAERRIQVRTGMRFKPQRSARVYRCGPINAKECWAQNTWLCRLAIHCRPSAVTFR